MKYNINNPRPTPSQELLKSLLDYDPSTGIMTWKKHPNRTDLNGKECGTVKRTGYRAVKIGRHEFSVHRIAYKIMTGIEANVVDHIDGNILNNGWDNLRSVTTQENSKNTASKTGNKTIYCGVSKVKSGRYKAIIVNKRKVFHLGTFDTVDEAIAARQAANLVFGYSDRHGKAA